jgi:hypothetical protein
MQCMLANYVTIDSLNHVVNAVFLGDSTRQDVSTLCYSYHDGL